jgi:hypothetical protein
MSGGLAEGGVKGGAIFAPGETGKTSNQADAEFRS